jgi:hypothetical protein
MVWGKQYSAREYFDITKPHIVWAYVPHQMVDGRWVWWQLVVRRASSVTWAGIDWEYGLP